MSAPLDPPQPATSTEPPARSRRRDERTGASRAVLAVLRSDHAYQAAWTLAACVVVLLFLGVAERIAYRGRVMPGVHVVAVDLGGEQELAAYGSLKDLARELETEPVRATASNHALAATPASFHLEVDARATVRRAREAGRSGNPLSQVLGTVLRRFRPDHVEPVVHFDADDVDAVVDHWAKQVDNGLREGSLHFDGTNVVEVTPRSGVGIDRDETKAAIVTALRTGERQPLRLTYGPISPRTTVVQLGSVANEARSILAHDLRVQSSGHTFVVTAAQTAKALTTRVDGTNVVLAVDRARLAAVLAPQLQTIGTPPVDASFKVTADNRVVVVPSQDGLQPDLAKVAAAILANERTVETPLANRHPVHDTAWAEHLGITEQVSSFTTYHPAGQARVTNIHRAADIMNNTIVLPGAVFSLNDTLGARTPQRGFVKAPVYYGEFTEDYGGGVSQIATTTYNAVFWGGFEVVFHQPHTIYYSRYPMGREATVNYPVLDLKWRNNSHHGVLVRATYTGTSITISLYGNSEGKVVKEESTNCSSTSPTRRCLDIVKTTPFITKPLRCPPADPKIDPTNLCAGLAPDQRLDLSEGHTGYDVTLFRVIDQPGRAEIRERHSWHYDMIPDVILVGARPKGTTTTSGPHSGTTTTTLPSTSTSTIP